MIRPHGLSVLRGILVGSFSLVLASPAQGHTSLIAPNGGEVLEVGSVTTITWILIVSHDLQNWDLWYSTDSGTSFIPIAMDLPPGDPKPQSIHTYDWTVPDTPSDQVRVRVRMENTIEDYYDESDGDFTIEGGSLGLTGACCFGNGSCTPQTQEDCEAVEGQLYLGDGTECIGDFTCPAVCRTCECVDGFIDFGESAIGCVAEESACSDVCQGHGGLQSFDCDLGPCPSIPAVSQWGLVVMTLLVLAAGAIIVRRGVSHS